MVIYDPLLYRNIAEDSRSCDIHIAKNRTCGNPNKYAMITAQFLCLPYFILCLHLRTEICSLSVKDV